MLELTGSMETTSREGSSAGATARHLSSSRLAVQHQPRRKPRFRKCREIFGWKNRRREFPLPFRSVLFRNQLRLTRRRMNEVSGTARQIFCNGCSRRAKRRTRPPSSVYRGCVSFFFSSFFSDVKI